MSNALDEAKFAAEIFLKRCSEIMAEESRAIIEQQALGNPYPYISRVPHAAAKRASMDLSRALSNLRKPGAI